MSLSSSWYDDDALLEAELRTLSANKKRDVVVSGYADLEPIGRGGQADVYRARHLATGRLVALKVFHDRPGRAAPVLRRFEREIDVVSSLRHPSIITLYDGGVNDGGRPWLCMEYFRGRPFDECAAAQEYKMDPANASARDRILRLVRTAAEAVAHAHLNGVIHRDLKPANILVDDQDNVRVLDFGLARLDPSFAGADSKSLEGHFVGTLAYASPEQARGEAADTRADVWSLGMILYEVLVGRRPYELPGNLREAIEVAADPRVTSARDILPDMPRDLDALLGRALHSDRNRRYPTADALCHELDRVLRGEPVEARGDSLWYVLARRVSRSRRTLAAIGSMLIVVSVALVVSINSERETRHANQALEEETRRLRSTLEWLSALIGRVDPDLDGEDVSLAVLLDRSLKDLETVFERDINSRIQVRQVLGGVYEKLGKYDRAEELLRSLIADLEVTGTREVDATIAQVALARIRFQRTRTEDLKPVLEPLIARMMKDPSAFRSTLHEARLTLAANLRARREFAAARHLYEDMAAGRDYTLSAKESLDLREYLCAITSMEGRPAEALALQQEIVAARDLARENAPLAWISSLGDLAYYLTEMNRLAEAEEVIERAEQAAGNRYGIDHPKTLTLAEHRAKLIQDQGRPEVAAPLFEDILVRRIRRTGEEHPNTLGTMNNLSVALGLSGDLEKARSMQARLVDVLRRTPAPDEFDFANALVNLATITTRLGRADEALPIYREAVGYAERHLGDENRHTATFRILMANALTRLGQFEESERLLLPSVTHLEKATGVDHPATRKARELLVELYTAWDRPADAARWRLNQGPD